MKRYRNKYIILIVIFMCSLSLTACTAKTSSPAYNPSPRLTISPTQYPVKDFPESSDTDSSASTASPTPAPTKNDVSLYVRGQTISLGENTDSVLQKLGSPSRIMPSEYNFDYYIYNNDYTRLAFIAISGDTVVGFYSDALDFNFKGICSGSGLSTVNKVLNSNFSLKEVLSKKTNSYTVNVLMDTIDTHKVTGIYVLPAKVKKSGYSEKIMKSMEQMVFDLTNSIRARNNVNLLSWSSSAALSARKHSADMADKDYFDHISLLGRTTQDRLTAEGIYYRTCGENIIAGYESAILSTHGWFNSTYHRKTMLNQKFQYMGAGFAYNSDSTYKTYLTQDFYQ